MAKDPIALHIEGQLAKLIRRTSSDRLTFAKAKVELNDLGLSLTKRDGEYRVNYRGAGEGPAYYTNDLEDALGTGRLMAQHKGSAQ